MKTMRFGPIWLAFGLLLASFAPCAAAETAQRELRVEGAVPARATLAVESLLGSVELRGGAPEGRFVVEARVEAEADELPAAIALAERIDVDLRETESGPVVHVVFPLDDHTGFHAPRAGKSKKEVALDWMASLLRRDGTAVRYEGRDVLIGKDKTAAALAVHLTVTVPSGSRTTVDLAAGRARAVRVPGEVRLAVQSGDIQAEQLYGVFEGKTGGGDVVLRSLKGQVARAETASGTIRLADIDVRELELRSTSGDLHAQSVRCDSVTAVVEQGEIALDGLDAATLSVAAGEGDIDLATKLDRTRAAEVHSAAGDVTLHLGEVTPFRLQASLEKGSLRSKLPYAQIDNPPGQDTVVTRGGGGADISLRLARGDVTLLTR